MKKLRPLPLFILGLAIIVVGFIFILGFIFEWAWFTFTNRILISLIVISLLAALATVIILLVTLGIRNKGKARWTAFLFVAVLLFGSSVFDPATIGVIGVPVGLILLGFSIRKLYLLGSATGKIPRDCFPVEITYKTIKHPDVVDNAHPIPFSFRWPKR